MNINENNHTNKDRSKNTIRMTMSNVFSNDEKEKVSIK
jgi:hypothetical protein